MYHFLTSDMRAGHSDEPPWTVGETRSIDVEPVLCEQGYHASPTLRDALRYAPGPIACIVVLGGCVVSDEDKSVATRRTLLSAVNVERELRIFACDCAEHVLHIYEEQYPGDKRPRHAIEVARRFISGKATDAELTAARAAAYAAARAAAYAAARAAWAVTSSFWDAAWSACAVAWAARAAATAVLVASNATWDGTEAEREWQAQRLDELILVRLDPIIESS